MADEYDDSEWKGWTHWLDQELSKTPNDEMLLCMKQMMEYKPEFDIGDE